MTFKTLSRAALATLVGLLLITGTAVAQTTVTSTTLAAAISDTAGTVMTITSATGWTASSASAEYFALVDQELLGVRTLSSTTVGITRGVRGTRAATHISGATIWFGPGLAFQSYTPSGQCTRTNLVYVPWIVAGDRDPSNNGQTFDCLGITTAGQWVSTNRPAPGYFLGSTVASAASAIAITGVYYKVSGTAAVTGFTLPAGWAPGMCIYIEPTGAFTTTTAGNIGLASTAVVGKVLIECWSGSKWQPSY